MGEDLALDPDFAPDERIFHYTSPQGLYGILEGECLWATHFRFLNDSKEFYAARESLTRFVKAEIHKQFAIWKVNGQLDFQEGEDLRQLAEHETTTIVDSFYNATYGQQSRPFVLSGFCCNPDHPSYRYGGLLHWATYGQRGGYAIRLNPHKLYALIREETKRFPLASFNAAKVVYSTDVPEVALKEDYQAIAATARAMLEGVAKNDMSGVDLAVSAEPFWRISSMLKDGYFRDEQEARVVFMLAGRDGHEGTPRHPLKMRHGAGITIPYIELFRDILLGENCPIEAILIGPHSERQRRHEALQIYLRERALNNIEIIESDVPYIS